MIDTTTKMNCIFCQKIIRGNENKKFCSNACKNSFHNAKRKQEMRQIGAIINILRTNRNILAKLLRDRETLKLSSQRLLDQGYIFRYHTHRRVNKGDGREYIFCFDYGYTELNSGWHMIVKRFTES